MLFCILESNICTHEFVDINVRYFAFCCFRTADCRKAKRRSPYMRRKRAWQVYMYACIDNVKLVDIVSECMIPCSVCVCVGCSWMSWEFVNGISQHTMTTLERQQSHTHTDQHSYPPERCVPTATGTELIEWHKFTFLQLLSRSALSLLDNNWPMAV